ncbi:nitroreductase family protein [Tissierella sp. MB52-C2]|uniref:nitroreductase family protein n=1 Tax=Tissierella sp. MB52-C2 TaxID=3070999 RepID=UPI00280A5DDB|nr:nitroreductase family protein [Tissierella sp. MB52-C2]WMM25725.1 nitroreductase family protein [Tissierella sp. MB52-C2]
MLMTNFLRERKSVREFKNKKIDVDVLSDIKVYLESIENEENNGSVRFSLYEYGEKLYNELKGVGGYSGVMIESPHYITLELMNNQESSIISSAYYMEKVITKLNNLGIDTCWVSIGNVEQDKKLQIFGEIIGEINYILAIGYGKARNPFVNDPISDRIGVEDLVFIDKIGNPPEGDELENRGLDDLFYYVRFAPSAFNKQPWRFLLKKDKVNLLIKYNDKEKPSLMDAGIIMYYFEYLANSIGINSKWELIKDMVVVEEDICYKYIGEFKL